MPDQAVTPKCPLCSSPMAPGKGKPSGSTVGVGCVGMIIGLVLCFMGPLFIIGAPIILISAVLGSIKQRGLRCTSRPCRHFVPRG